MIGNGMAGVRTIEELLKLDPELYDITIFGAEPHPNYNRILLSPEMTTRLNDMGVYHRADSPAAAREFFASQQRAMRKMVGELGIQPQ